MQRTLKMIVTADQTGLRWVADLRRPLLDRIMRGVSRAGDASSWTVVLLAGLLAGPPFREVALYVIPKLLLTLAICYTIKALSKRPRPTKSGFAALLKDPDPYSFPSSHSACAWTVCIALGLMLGGGWALLIPYAAAISYSRVHVGAHYPLDVAIGTTIGTLVALLAF